MIELIDFIRKFISDEMLVPFIFLLIILYIKYVIMPWNQMLKVIHDNTDTIKNTESTNFDQLKKELMKNIVDEIKTIRNKIDALTNTVIRIDGTHDKQNEIISKNTQEISKVLSQLNALEKKIDEIAHNVISRLESVKDEGKDSKLDFSQQIFSIKQEISDLKSKIEPLLFVSRGIK